MNDSMTFFKHNAIKLYYEIDQNESLPTLLCIHGWGTSRNIWEKASNYLQTYYRLLKVDLPGMGFSPYKHPLGEKDYLRKSAEAIQSLIQHLKIKKFSLLGHSFGGLVACIVSELLTPNALVLDSTPLMGEAGLPTKVKLYGMPKILRKPLYYATLGSNIITYKMIQNTFKEVKVIPKSKIDSMVKDFQNTDHLAFYHCLKSAYFHPVVEKLKTYQYPILYIIGKDNITLNKDMMITNLKNNSSLTNVVEVPNAGHYPQIEQPQIYYNQIRSFLKKAGNDK